MHDPSYQASLWLAAAHDEDLRRMVSNQSSDDYRRNQALALRLSVKYDNQNCAPSSLSIFSIDDLQLLRIFGSIGNPSRIRLCFIFIS